MSPISMMLNIKKKKRDNRKDDKLFAKNLCLSKITFFVRRKKEREKKCK
jgi:hypothetical protein